MTGSTHQTEMLLFTVLLQLIVMIGAARVMHGLFRRMGQPGVVGEIVAGLLLGPSLFGHFFPGVSLALFGAKPEPAVTVLSQIGLILLMFQIGSEFEFGRLKIPRLQRTTISVALASILAPFLAGIGIGQLSASSLAPGVDPLVYSLFCGVAIAITAVPILGRILGEYGLTRSDVGIVAISAAAVNDVVGWILLAGIAAFAAAQLSVAYLAVHLGGLAVFLAALRFVAAPLCDRLVARLPLKDGTIPPHLLAVLLIVIFALAVCTFSLGIFAIFGGFAAGLLFHRHRPLVGAWNAQVGQFVLVFFLPIFFTFTGLRTNLLGLSSGPELVWLAAVCLIAVLAKIVPVYCAGRANGFTHHESLTLGALMNTRGLMELIVLNVGYDLGFLPRSMFTILVVMAVVTTVMTGPILRALRNMRAYPPHIPHAPPQLCGVQERP
ncbi:cation:proton antiporter [Novosphingobium sp. P6W]|uniref:cation:proton antiporter n=1 Tax=Novosphingobium sp. P6W TaxID=1609758 RepID=UPI0005C2E0B5|nr:cation:proton antiporter [Novosphingobium sp. P6W]AXB79476.1 potassium transporter Kef [Novosphingobium sp. P6W]KIS34236.1 potassium transporter Kef [Novosphingobium sp. P6W]